MIDKIVNWLLPKKQVIIVLGKMCSGKQHFCETHFGDFPHVATSDVVKMLSGFTTRDALNTTADLDNQIADELLNIIDKTRGTLVIDGIRQFTILQKLLLHRPNVRYRLYWLEVPTEVLRERYYNRKDAKDVDEFEIALAKDAQLGLDHLEHYVKFLPSTTIIEHY